VDNVEELKELNLEVGDIKISDAVEFADEQIALEAILVMKSIVNKHPNPSSIRKYILAIKQYHQGKLYPFPFWVVSPIFLRFIEPLPFNNSKNIQESDLLGRFNWALGILESGELAPLVYNYRPDKSNRITLLWFFISEIVFLPIRWLYWKLKQ
jgi:hypothetical protein